MGNKYLSEIMKWEIAIRMREGEKETQEIQRWVNVIGKKTEQMKRRLANIKEDTERGKMERRRKKWMERGKEVRRRESKERSEFSRSSYS